MNKLLVLSGILALIATPACQTQKLKERVYDQDEQLQAMQSERHRLLSERDRVRAENAELEDRLNQEFSRNRELRDRLAAMEDSMAAADAEVEELRASLSGTGVGVSRRGGLVVLDLPQAITFPSGKATLSEQGRTSLTKVAATLKGTYPESSFWIEGHTDNDPIQKSNWRSNLQLSVERALVVAEFLTDEQGLPSESVRVAGHGPNQPKGPNDSAEGKAQNRRVEILILNPKN